MSLVNRLKRKEEEAVVEMMNLYGDNLLRTAVLLLKDMQLAEEVVQDTFVIAYQKIGQLLEEEKLKSWLLTIATNECRAKMRKWSWKHIFLHKKEEMEGQIWADCGKEPEQIVLTTQRNENLYEAIQQLPYKYREAVTLYYFQELTIKEVASLIGEKDSTVKTRLFRGKQLLKNHLEKGGRKSC